MRIILKPESGLPPDTYLTDVEHSKLTENLCKQYTHTIVYRGVLMQKAKVRAVLYTVP